MSEEGGIDVESEKGIALREKVRDAINNPLKYTQDSLRDEMIFENATLPRVESFFKLIEKELFRARNREGIKLSQKLIKYLDEPESNKGFFEHELAHVKAAASLGIDMSKCRIIAGFKKGKENDLDLELYFQYPYDNVPPDVRIKIALAPDEPTIGDLLSAHNILNHKRSFFERNSDLHQEVLTLFAKRKEDYKASHS